MKIIHPPKIEYQDKMLLMTKYENEDTRTIEFKEPIEIKFIKVQEDRRMTNVDGVAQLTSGNVVFVDTKWSRGYNNILEDFADGSKVKYANDTYTIDHTEYCRIQGQLHHIEVFLV